MEMVGYLIKSMHSPATGFWLCLRTMSKFPLIERPLSPMRKLLYVLRYKWHSCSTVDIWSG